MKYAFPVVPLLLMIVLAGCSASNHAVDERDSAPASQASTQDYRDFVPAEVQRPVYVYEEPDTRSNEVAQLDPPDSFYVWDQGRFFAVATKDEGHIGYALRGFISVVDGDVMRTAMQDSQVQSASRVIVANQLKAPGQPGYKDPGLATLISVLITGGGHIYSGDTGTGLTLLGVAAIAPAAGYLAAVETGKVNRNCIGHGVCFDQPEWGYLYAGAMLGGMAWVYGVVTSSDAARRANGQGMRASAAPAPVVDSYGYVRPGVRLSLEW